MKLTLKAGAAGKAKVIAQAKGLNALVPPLPLALPVRVQLQSASGFCLESLHDGGGVKSNDAEQFKGTGG